MKTIVSLVAVMVVAASFAWAGGGSVSERSLPPFPKKFEIAIPEGTPSDIAKCARIVSGRWTSDRCSPSHGLNVKMGVVITSSDGDAFVTYCMGDSPEWSIKAGCFHARTKVKREKGELVMILRRRDGSLFAYFTFKEGYVEARMPRVDGGDSVAKLR